jgi:hypothetical protein
MISRLDVVLQGHAQNGDYLTAGVHLELGEDNVVRYYDGDEWRPLNVVVRRVPISPPGTASDIHEMRRRLFTDSKPVDLGDDPDGDLEGYDGA